MHHFGDFGIMDFQGTWQENVNGCPHESLHSEILIFHFPQNSTFSVDFQCPPCHRGYRLLVKLNTSLADENLKPRAFKKIGFAEPSEYGLQKLHLLTVHHQAVFPQTVHKCRGHRH